jgi:hypothetical protein
MTIPPFEELWQGRIRSRRSKRALIKKSFSGKGQGSTKNLLAL